MSTRRQNDSFASVNDVELESVEDSSDEFVRERRAKRKATEAKRRQKTAEERRVAYDKAVPYLKMEKVLQKLRVRAYKGRMLRDLCLYIMFIVVFMLITFLSRDLRKLYFVENALKDIFVYEEFSFEDAHIYKSFHDIGEVEEFWMWMRGPLVSALSQTNQLEQGYILGVNRLIGAPRIRQVRVKNRCVLDAKLTAFFDACYPVYSFLDRETAPFGPGVVNAANASAIKAPDTYDEALASARADVGEGSLPSVYHYFDWEAPPVYGWITWYDGSGYVRDLSYNNDVTRAIIAQMERDEWVDLQTRMVIVTVNVYNANVNTFVAMSFLIEMTAGGGFVTSSSFRSFKADAYLNATDKMRAVLEAIFCVGLLWWIGYTMSVLWRLKRRGGSALIWFTRPWWNSLDLLNKLLLLVNVIYYIVHNVQLWLFMRNLTNLEQTTDFSDLETLGWSSEILQNITAANIFVGMFTIFKYLSVNVRMSMLWRTLMKAAGDLLAFTVFFFIIFIGFVLTGHILFGPALYDFRSVGRSFFTCFQMLLGEFAYEDMEERGNRVLAPIYFGLYMILVFFILVNMFVAIVTDAYAIVHEESQSSTTIGSALRRNVVRALSHAQARWNRYFGSAQNLSNMLQGRVISSHQCTKYIEFLRRRVNDRFRVAPAELTRDDFELLLDAPRDVSDRLYALIVDYAIMFDADDARDEEEDRADAIQNELEGLRSTAATVAEGQLHPLRQGRVTLETVGTTAQRLATRMERLERKSNFLLR